MKKLILSLLLITVVAIAYLMLTRDPIGPGPTPPVISNIVKVKIDNIDIYLENSDSMNGYVTGTAEFESDLLVLLNNVKNSEEKNSDTTNWKNISLNYINSEIVPIDTIQKDSNNDQGIKEFLSNLDVKEFRKSKKGKQDRTISDISNILEIVTNKTNRNTVSILVSDFIFSPGKGIDPREYLIRQEALIKDIFERKIKDIKDLSVLIIHNEATFNGTYFTKTNAKIKLPTDAAREVKRPYYIWVIGTSNNVESFMKSSQFKSIRGYKNNALFESFSIKPKYSIQMIKGKTTSDKNELAEMKDKHSITEAIVNSKSEFMFNLNINYGNHASDIERTISENGKNLKFVNPALIPSGKNNDTIIVEYESNKTEKGKDWNSELTIVITKALDKWISEVHTDDDDDMENNLSLHRKTFGLKNLIQGVRSAFYKTNYRNDSILKDTIYTINFPIIFKEK
jgi:hypothetical protein